MIWITALTITLILFAVLFRARYETRHFKLTEYEIKTDKVSDEIKLGFITDLHNCCYGDKNKSVINAILNMNLQMLIIGGDMIVGKRNIGDNNAEELYGHAIELLKGISGMLPVYYVYGNHETRVKNRRRKNRLYDEYAEKLSALKVELINDATVIWRDDRGNQITLTGIEIEEPAYDEEEYRIDRGKIGTIEDGKGYRILVAHPPDFFEEYAKEDVDLILCGHNHGGTVRLPFIGGVVSRDYKLFPKYSYGIYEKNGRKMILSSGLGDHTIHFRLFNMPEIVVVRLLPGNK